jgi:ketosteroid isomerase-like protein
MPWGAEMDRPKISILGASNDVQRPGDRPISRLGGIPAAMVQLSAHVLEFIRLFEAGETALALEKYYAEDVVVFENRELARSGRAQCVEFERKAVEQLETPPKMKVIAYAVNEDEGTAFIEWLVRMTPRGGEPHRLEEVSVQLWEQDKIVRERHYYEGYVDEGWESPEDTPPNL